MRAVMNDKELEKQFQQDGYVIIPFLNDSEVADLKKAFFELLPTSGGNITAGDTGMHLLLTTSHSLIRTLSINKPCMIR